MTMKNKSAKGLLVLAAMAVQQALAHEPYRQEIIENVAEPCTRVAALIAVYEGRFVTVEEAMAAYAEKGEWALREEAIEGLGERIEEKEKFNRALLEMLETNWQITFGDLPNGGEKRQALDMHKKVLDRLDSWHHVYPGQEMRQAIYYEQLGRCVLLFTDGHSPADSD